MPGHKHRHGKRARASDVVGASTSFPIVGVGASAGGLEAFTELLQQLPSNTGMAFVLIQHLDPAHPSYLREALSRTTNMPVDEVREGVHVEPDHVYVLPSNADVGILKGTLTLLPRPTEARRPHLAVDFFLSALAADRANQAIAVILSGTGADGTEGLRAIKAAGGITFAQDPRSAKFGGMPEAAIRAGVADFVLPIPELSRKLEHISQHPFLLTRADEPMLESGADDAELERVLVLVRGVVGVDFSDYKLASVRRRLARRMAMKRITSLHEYVQLLRDDKAEIRALFEDILIHVTSFFRDPDVFTKLDEVVFPEILSQKRAGGTIRIWCAGCSTGEEAYSLMIALREFLSRENASDVPIQLFATDISDKALEVARAGVYRESAVRELGSERLARYFVREEGGDYRISKSIRERCAFVRHDLVRDPPFSKLDLVTCRNVLIYFGSELQQRVIGVFHFALNYPGFLVLGRAESLAGGTSLFTVIDKEARIFARTVARSTLRIASARDTAPLVPSPAESGRRAAPLENLLRQAETRLLDQYAPPGVIVNERMEILRFRGRTGAYLEPAPGEPHHDLVKMARQGLVADLRIALSQAQKDGASVRRVGVRIDHEGSSRVCDLVVIPVASPPQSPERLFAVLFEEQQPAGAASAAPALALESPDAPGEAARITTLQAELEATKAYLQSLIDGHRRTNDDLLSVNEELVSTNEELQSLNEELETAKEELQSTNEELSTLNEELHARNAELDAVNSDLINILASVEVPIVIVDAGRRIRRFTPKARPILNLLPSDVGRPIDDIRPNLALDNLDQQIAEVVETIVTLEREVQDRDGRWYRLQIRPYMTTDKRIDGAVISVIDIDVLKRALGAAEGARDYASAIVEAVRTPLVVLDARHIVVSSNEAFRAHFRTPETELEGRGVHEVLGGVWDLDEVRAALRRVSDVGDRFDDLELERDVPLLGMRTVSLSGRSVATPSGERLIVLSVEDITVRWRGEAERERLLANERTAKASADAANRAKDQFLAMLSHELRTPLSTLVIQSDLLTHTPMNAEMVRKSGEAIGRAAKAQAQLIDDLLDISRIVTGKLRMEQQIVSLAPIVRAAIDVIRPSAERKHIDLELEVDDSMPPVSGDPARLQQVVLNLLTNAVKFTPDRGRVSVRVDADDGHGCIQVRDTGTGIDPSFLPHVFQRFSQEDREHTRSFGGLGLGLGIVRYVVEAHGGTVRADSEGKGKGATFTVRIPLLSADAANADREQATPESRVGGIEGVRVLIVEDDPGTRDALTEMLRSTGADVRSAESAAAGMKVFEAFQPDLLVCDIAMPDEDGYHLLGRIRALSPERGGAVPALALTALAGDEDRRRAIEAGFQMHLAKPVDMKRLVAALARLHTFT